jgi:hypothetical protein
VNDWLADNPLRRAVTDTKRGRRNSWQRSAVFLPVCNTGERRFHHFQPGDLRHRRMVSHTPMSSLYVTLRKAGLRRSDTPKGILAGSPVSGKPG